MTYAYVAERVEFPDARNCESLQPFDNLLDASRIDRSAFRAEVRAAFDMTNRRRSIQTTYNDANGITPRTVSRTREEIIAQSSILDIRGKKSLAYVESEELSMAADPVTDYMSKEQFEKLMSQTEKKMKDAAKDLDFIMAAQFRDELFAMKKKFKDRYGMLTWFFLDSIISA